MAIHESVTQWMLKWSRRVIQRCPRSPRGDPRDPSGVPRVPPGPHVRLISVGFDQTFSTLSRLENELVKIERRTTRSRYNTHKAKQQQTNIHTHTHTHTHTHIHTYTHTRTHARMLMRAILQLEKLYVFYSGRRHRPQCISNIWSSEHLHKNITIVISEIDLQILKHIRSKFFATRG